MHTYISMCMQAVVHMWHWQPISLTLILPCVCSDFSYVIVYTVDMSIQPDRWRTSGQSNLLIRLVVHVFLLVFNQLWPGEYLYIHYIIYVRRCCLTYKLVCTTDWTATASILISTDSYTHTKPVDSITELADHTHLGFLLRTAMTTTLMANKRQTVRRIAPSTPNRI